MTLWGYGISSQEPRWSYDHLTSERVGTCVGGNGIIQNGFSGMRHSEWIMAPPAFLQLRTEGYSCAPIRECGMEIFRNAAFGMRNGSCFSIPPNAGYPPDEDRKHDEKGER